MIPHHTVLLGPMLIAGLAVITASEGRAQGKFDASYTISVARIPLGKATASADFSESDYTITMAGRANGILRVLASGDGTLTTTGTIKDGRPVPARYVSSTVADDDKLEVRMTFEDGSVKELVASDPPPMRDRVPLTDAHRKNVIDPLTGFLLSSPDGRPSEAACQRTMPIFDGRRRYDLRLAFKSLETVKADRGYAGPAVVCSVVLVPIAGHRASSPLVKFLSDGRAIEMTFVPVAGTRILAPFRIVVSNTLGNLVLQADRFEVAPLTPSATTPGRTQ